MIWLWSILGFSGLATVAYLVYQIREWSISKYKRDEAVDTVKELRDVKKISNRVERDAAYRNRVRDKYR